MVAIGSGSQVDQRSRYFLRHGPGGGVRIESFVIWLWSHVLRRAPNTTSASYWLCRRQRSEMLSNVAAPPFA